MQRHNPKFGRRGATIVETIIALLVLSAAMLALAQMVALAARQRRTTETRRIALQEVANQAERIAVLSWDQAEPGRLTTWEPSQVLAAAIPAAECRIEVTAEEGPPAARRVRLSVGWNDASGQPVTPVELSLWKYAEGQP
jgi:Tfp pilus assembly protein PilV